MSLLSLARRVGLLSPSAVADVLQGEFGLDLDPADVEKFIGYARKATSLKPILDERVSGVTGEQISQLVKAWDLSLDRPSCDLLSDTIQKMVTSPEETVRDFIAAGKWKRLISLGPEGAPIRTAAVICGHCGGTNFRRS